MMFSICVYKYVLVLVFEYLLMLNLDNIAN